MNKITQSSKPDQMLTISVAIFFFIKSTSQRDKMCVRSLIDFLSFRFIYSMTSDCIVHFIVILHSIVLRFCSALFTSLTRFSLAAAHFHNGSVGSPFHHVCVCVCGYVGTGIRCAIITTFNSTQILHYCNV